MRAIGRFVDMLVSASAVIAGAAVVLMMVHVSVDVTLRYLVNSPPPGTITFVSNYYMVALVCLPLAFVERMNGHISVEVLTERFPSRFGHHLYNLTLLLSASVTALVCWATWQEAVSKYMLQTFIMERQFRIPIWYGYFALPAGYGLMTLYLLLKFAAYVTGTPLAPSRAAADGFAGGERDD